jgi:hypothetical protein
MWMCIRSCDDGNDSADVSFGGGPQEAYKNYCENVRDDVDADEMNFYELKETYKAQVVWTMTPAY